MTTPNNSIPESSKWIIRILGSLQVQSPTGEKTEYPGTKSGVLLGFLAYNLGRTYTREVLAEMFWPDGDPTNQRTRLRQELGTLRALLNADSPSNANVLLSTSKTVQLSAEYVVTDVQLFLSSLERAANADPTEKERLIEQAVSLYRGDLLKDYPDNLTIERSLLGHRYEQGLRDLAAVLREKEDFRGAEERLKQLLQYNPLEEEVHVDLMRLYAMAGQTANIRRQYQILGRTLQEQFGADPSVETQRICQELLQHSRTAETLPVARISTPSPEREDCSHIPDNPQPDQYPSAILPDLPQLAGPRRVAFDRRYQRIILAACLALVGVLGFFIWRAFMPRSTATAPMPLLRYQETYTYLYEPDKGEIDDSEAKAVIGDADGNIYATGLIKTQKEDVDILTVKLTSDLKPAWMMRYWSPEHDCDRAASLTLAREGGLYVVGETYVPEGHKDKEGWHTVLIKYDQRSGTRLWVRRSPDCAHNDQLRIRVEACGGNGVAIGYTLHEKNQDKLRIMRYDRDGNLLWSKSYSAAPGLSATFCDLAVDAEGNVYACGVVERSAGTGAANNDWIVLCCSPSGEEKWHDFVDGPAHAEDAAYRIFLNGDRVVVAGVLSTGDPARGGHGDCLALANYTLDGKLLWKTHDPETGPTVEFNSCSFDGYSLTYILAGTRTLANGNSAVVFERYDLAGNRAWLKSYTPPPGYTSSHGAITVPFGDEILLAGKVSPHHASATYKGDCEMFFSRLSTNGDIETQCGLKFGYGLMKPEAVAMLSYGQPVYAGQALCVYNR